MYASVAVRVPENGAADIPTTAGVYGEAFDGFYVYFICAGASMAYRL